MNFIKPIFLLFFFINLLFSNETNTIDNTTSYKEILTQSEIFFDHTQKLTLEEIKTKTFQKNDSERLSFGYSPDFTVWIKFTLKNKTNQPLQKIVEYANPLTTHIELCDEEKIFKDGLFQINHKRETLNPTFEIILLPNQTKTYYIKTSSYITSLIVKLNLWDKELFQKESKNHNMILAMFFASMLILTIYNLLIYFFTKDRNYLLYVLYMIGTVIHQLFYTGFVSVYFFNQEFIMWGVRYATLIVAFPVLMFAFLVKSFLKLSQYPLWNKVLMGYLVLFVSLLPLFIFTDNFNQYRNLLSVMLLLFLIIISIYATLKKNRQAYFVLFGWFLFAIASFGMYLSSSGVLDIFDDFKYFVEIALIFEALIFSIALADKINQLTQKKNEANMELILNQQFEKQRLEYQVKEKTKALQKAYDEKNLLLKELNHRVKNNMQTIISLIRLQTNEIKEESIKKIFETTYNRINAMSKLHELLYNQTDFYNINANIYLQNLIDELKSGFESEDIKINFDIQTTIKTKDAVYCGLIVNELVTNSLKYAFQDNIGTINIQFIQQSDSYILSIEDDGIGYDEGEIQASLGLTLIETLAKNQLKGRIQKDTTKGVKIVIVWSSR